MSEFLEDDGIWCQVLRPEGDATLRGRPALFLDRDGVLVEEVHYLHRPEDACLIAGAAALIKAANSGDIAVVVVTNQSGIGRGAYDWAAFAVTQDKILADLANLGATVDMVLACPYHAEAKPPYQHPAHPCRKPQPGMLLRAAERLGLELSASWIIGDQVTDMAAGQAADLAGGLHVLTGHGRDNRAAVKAMAGHGFQIRLGDSIADGLDLLPLT